MTASPRPQPAARYTIRLAARLDTHWEAWFDGFAVTGESDGTTTLAGTVADQAQLHSLLARIRDLGIVLLSVEAEVNGSALK